MQGSRWQFKRRVVGPRLCFAGPPRLVCAEWVVHRVASAVGVSLVFPFPSRPCADGTVTWRWWVRRASPVQVRGTDTSEAPSARRSEGLGAAAVSSLFCYLVGIGLPCRLFPDLLREASNLDIYKESKY